MDRHWLIYSPKSNRLHCSCCWLFECKDKDTLTWADPKHGFSKFRKGLERIERHEQSKTHREAEKTFLMMKYRISQDSTVILGLMKAERERVERNRQVLRRLIDASLFLARQGPAFCGHREYAGLGAPGVNEGNFLELLKLLAKYDAIIDQHLKNRTIRNKYLTPPVSE